MTKDGDCMDAALKYMDISLNCINRPLKNFIYRLESYKLYRQERVVRWQMRDYMFKSNDCEHQLYVTQITLILSEIFNIPDIHTVKALKYACCHDYVESTENSLGDINYMLKERNPALKQIVKEQERIAMKSVNEFYHSMCQCEEDDIAIILVTLADALEALLYVRREIKFNKQSTEWEQIADELLPRIEGNWVKLTKLSEKWSVLDESN